MQGLSYCIANSLIILFLLFCWAQVIGKYYTKRFRRWKYWKIIRTGRFPQSVEIQPSRKGSECRGNNWNSCKRIDQIKACKSITQRRNIGLISFLHTSMYPLVLSNLASPWKLHLLLVHEFTPHLSTYCISCFFLGPAHAKVNFRYIYVDRSL